MKTLKEKHNELCKLLGSDEAVRKLHGFYDRAIRKEVSKQGLGNQMKGLGNQIRGEIIIIVEHLNKITGYHYRITNRETRKLIRARLSEKFTVEDFKHVHIVKTKEWKNTDNRRYLRPSTLYSASHFEGYLQEYIMMKQEADERERKRKLMEERDKMTERAQRIVPQHESPLSEKPTIDDVLKRWAKKRKL